MNISAASWPITTNFYLKHHWGGGKDALGFGPDRIGTLISMATYSSQGYNGEHLVTTLVPVILIGSSSFLQLTRTTINL